MRQVPSYLLIGNGRVARHFYHYLTLLSLPVTTWHRSQSLSDLQTQLKNATHVLVLIRDDAIETFVQEHLANTSAQCVHFSGSLVSEYVVGAHPLMTFSHDLYDLALYQSVPFIVDENAPEFSTLLPGLPNPHARINTAQKAKYHALCVLSGNFSCLLWQKLFSGMEKELGLPASFAIPYLLQVTHNLQQQPHAALTGPLTRGDTRTLQANLAALQGDPYQTVYESFMTCFEQLKRKQA